MKKHSVDDLFAQQLAGLQIKPSASAKAKFVQALSDKELDALATDKLSVFEVVPSNQAKAKFEAMLDNQTKRAKAPYKLWYVGTAASVAVLIGFGIFTTQNTDKQTIVASTVKNNQSKEVKINSEKQTFKKPENKVILFKDVRSMMSEVIQTKQVTQENETKSTIEPSQVVESLVASVFPESKIEIEKNNIEDSREVVSNLGKQMPITPIVETEVEDELTMAFSSPTSRESSFEQLRKFDEEPIGLVELVNNDEYFFLNKRNKELREDKELNFFQKLAIQVRHIKHGGKINPRELGIRPRDLMAKADRFINEELHWKDISTSKTIVGN